ncbi:MAG: hypothetical protein V6Z86_01870 [Hyphomicrobiales bacterium]
MTGIQDRQGLPSWYHTAKVYILKAIMGSCAPPCRTRRHNHHTARLDPGRLWTTTLSTIAVSSF